MAQMVKILPANTEKQVLSLGWEDPLEEGMATHSSILPGVSPWTEEPGGLQPVGSQRVRRDGSDLTHAGRQPPYGVRQRCRVALTLA